MIEWSEDPGAGIGSLNLNFSLMEGLWLNGISGGALRWKVKIVG
jgi:hypothetical protein